MSEFACSEATGCGPMAAGQPRKILAGNILRKDYDAGIVLTTLTEHTYDQYGNIASMKETVSGNGAQHIQVSEISYIHRLAEPRLMGLVCEKKKYAGFLSASALVAHERLHFDESQNHCQVGQNGKALLTNIAVYTGDGWGNQPREYDGYGNIVATTALNGVKEEITLDDDYETYPSKKKINIA